MTILLLPRLKSDATVTVPSQSGNWDMQYSTAFNSVADSLDYQTPGEAQTISAVPTVWSRPKTVEMALYNSKHPLHQQMVQQWQGMLAAIALAEIRGFPLTVEFLDLKTFRDNRGKFQDDFAEAAYKLAPNHQHPRTQTLVNTILYTLDGDLNPWYEHYIFLWQGRPVGMTSPSTIVVPSEMGEWPTLPWWTNVQGNRMLQSSVLQSPIQHLDLSEQSLLSGWLKNFHDQLPNFGGAKDAIARIKMLLANFRDALSSDPTITTGYSTNPAPFGIPIARGGVLSLLNKPVKNTQERLSSVQLVTQSPQTDTKPLLIIDPNLATIWGVQPQNIVLHQGKTLATPNLIENLRARREVWNDVRWIHVDEVFLPQLTFLNKDNAFPGGLPLNVDGPPLIYNGQNITPLLPINPILLDYFTPEELNDAVKIQQANLPQGPGIRVFLNLKLTGLTSNGLQRIDLPLYRDYLLDQKQGIAELPVLQIWPNFTTPNWKLYYGFYFDGEYKNATFQVEFPGAQDKHSFEEGAGSYVLSRFDRFPRYLKCKKQNEDVGLILLKTPTPIPTGKAWKIGVDFGTSFTNIYVNGSQSGNNAIAPLQIKNLQLKVTESDLETRLPSLFEYFLPEEFAPSSKPLPLSTVLTSRGALISESKAERPIFDGRFFIPNSAAGFNPAVEWIKTNLKWEISNLPYNRIFLKHLMIYVSAIAASEQVNSIAWSLSYPSAFSKSDTLRYVKVWKQTMSEIQDTGITYSVPEITDSDRFRTESLAIAQFFADFNGSPQQNLIHTTCLDVGGGTSDISIWQGNDLVHQCSVQFAGRDLFSKFLLDDGMKFFKSSLLSDAERGTWNNLKDYKFNAKLDVWLRFQSDNWLQNHRDFLEDNPKFQGFIRLVTLGYAGLFYYIGIILKALKEEGKLQREEITPVCIGGNGSRFLNWLVTGGTFSSGSDVRDLLSRMMSQGSWFKCDSAFTLSNTELEQRYHDFEPGERGFKDSQVPVFLSPQPKDEVAFGLVLNDTNLKGLDRRAIDPLIAGERFKINGEEKGQETRIEATHIQQLEIATLPEMQRFLYSFHQALKELRVEEITPLPSSVYTPSLHTSRNERLWGETRTRLEVMRLKNRGKPADDVRVEPPFILGLKALLQVLGEEWAQS